MATPCDLSLATRQDILDTLNATLGYVGCYVGDPFGAGVEVATCDRVAVTWVAADADGISVNNGDIIFPAGSFDDDAVDYYALFAADTGGSPVWRAALTTPRTPALTDSLTIPDGELSTALPASVG